jgi:hypothetical protein
MPGSVPGQGTNVQISFPKTNNHHQNTTAAKSRPGASRPIDSARRSAHWKPQPSGMTRDETREAVLEMIG